MSNHTTTPLPRGRNDGTTDEMSHREGGQTQRDGPADPPVDLDQIFTVLRNRRRRHILRYLDTEAPQVDRGTLAERIAARERDKETDQLTAQERKRVYVSLHQNHLPMMTEMDAITYDTRSGRIEAGPNCHYFLAHLPREERPAGSPTVGHNGPR